MFGCLEVVEFTSSWRRRRSRQVYTLAVIQARLIGEAGQYRDDGAVLLRRPAVLSSVLAGCWQSGNNRRKALTNSPGARLSCPLLPLSLLIHKALLFLYLAVFQLLLSWCVRANKTAPSIVQSHNLVFTQSIRSFFFKLFFSLCSPP